MSARALPSSPVAAVPENGAGARGEWLSAHLFHADGERGVADRVVREVVGPFVAHAGERGWVERYFFIRYRELGPHVRLRLHGPPGVLRSAVRPALEAFVAARLRPELAGRPREDAAGAGERSPVPALRWIPYVPESVRYGGAEGVRLAEEIFFHSSQAAVALLACFEPGEDDARFGLAMAAMVVLLGVLTRDRRQAATVALVHRENWARATGLDSAAVEAGGRFDAGYGANAGILARLREIWAALDEGPDALPEPLDGYAAGLLEVVPRLRATQEAGKLERDRGPIPTWEAAMRMLAPAYLHMMNNRLGVTPAEESYLAHLIARAFGG